MADDNKRVIRIESILGGHSPTTHFAASNQFRSSLGIDPGLPTSQSGINPYAITSSGLIRPAYLGELSSATADVINWITTHPKKSGGVTPNIYIYDQAGSVYSIVSSSPSTITGLGDLNDGGTSEGNGAAYYDNYI